MPCEMAHHRRTRYSLAHCTTMGRASPKPLRSMCVQRMHISCSQWMNELKLRPDEAPLSADFTAGAANHARTSGSRVWHVSFWFRITVMTAPAWFTATTVMLPAVLILSPCVQWKINTFWSLGLFSFGKQVFVGAGLVQNSSVHDFYYRALSVICTLDVRLNRDLGLSSSGVLHNYSSKGEQMLPGILKWLGMDAVRAGADCWSLTAAIGCFVRNCRWSNNFFRCNGFWIPVFCCKIQTNRERLYCTAILFSH